MDHPLGLSLADEKAHQQPIFVISLSCFLWDGFCGDGKPADVVAVKTIQRGSTKGDGQTWLTHSGVFGLFSSHRRDSTYHLLTSYFWPVTSSFQLISWSITKEIARVLFIKQQWHALESLSFSLKLLDYSWQLIADFAKGCAIWG